MSLKELAPTYYSRLSEALKEVGRPKKLLHAGCGDGLYDKYLKKRAKEIVSFDLNKGDIQIATAINPEKNVKYYIGDVGNIPYKDNTFDCIICIDVLEHIKDEKKAISELTRVLKKGGRLIVTGPSKDFPFTYDPINYILNRFGKKLKIGIWGWGHERLYRGTELPNKVNLKVVKIKYMCHALTGVVENGYVNNFLQRFVKNDPKNQAKVSKNIKKIKKSVDYKLPKLFTNIRDLVIWADRKIFSTSKESICIMAIFEK
ncbi:MAG: class I SAM-dependent methyltransferase [Nanoarchaeota archaeon]|nr:class I SAM-dependent methyltransferase [Nanoarchaeota archaeon]